MISKVIPPGKSFKGLCEYLCKDLTRASVIDSVDVRTYDYRLMAADFERQRLLNPNLKSPVLHLILSYYPGEQISDQKMADIAKEYLTSLSIKDTQFALVRHNDRDHPHTHIIVNRVDNHGKTIKDNWIGLKGKKAAQRLTRKHGLKEAITKNPERSHNERLNDYEAARNTIYMAIRETLPKCRNLQEVQANLGKQQIHLLYKYKGKTTEVQGVSFELGKFKFKGSEIDRQFSYKNLEKQIGQNRLVSERKSGLSGETQNSLQLWEEAKQPFGTDLLWQLLEAEKVIDYLPPDFKKKKKKRQQKSRGL